RQMGAAQVLLAGALKPISYFGYDGYPSQLVPDERLFTLGGPVDDSVAALEALATHLGAAAVVHAAAPRKPVSASHDATLSPEIVVETLLEQ
ncbi:hypothetical protein, partial [Escherichia coli]|uniref:hypothetical protein n=1 Tax=Escherichia coli TaxID=562 RepID=UPI003D368B8E